MMPFTPAAWQSCFARMEQFLGWSLSARQRAGLQHYSLLLLQANQQFNLMGPSAAGNLLTRHFLDAVPLFPFMGPAARVADLGAGGGVPGVVLAILAQPPQTLHLIESRQKKARFLEQVVAELALGDRVQVFAVRAEQLGAEQKSSYDLVVSRALGSLLYGATLARPLLSPTGSYLALKGDGHGQDLEQFQQSSLQAFFQRPQVYPAMGEGGGVVVRLQRRLDVPARGGMVASKGRVNPKLQRPTEG
ncbi:MAG: 16S rRNA (guanine(527)-N(7))-methyltransferase RsmG [Magnetococcales bacterium]|nr:16S rRNA (guanine(527)-N(7))-methyltransferase RsmG [Magnetococcales bacterium]